MKSWLNWRTLGGSLAPALVVALVMALRISHDRESHYFQLLAQTGTPGKMQLFYDHGAGFDESLSQKITYRADGQWVGYRFQLAPATYHQLRLDPFERGGAVTYDALEVIRADGTIVHRFRRDDVTVREDIATLQFSGSRAHVVASGQAQDASLYLSFAQPLTLRPSLRTWITHVLLPGVTALLLGLLVATPPSRRILIHARAWCMAHPAVGRTMLIATFCLVFVDWPDPPSPELDPSWQAALVDAHQHDRQWGREIIFTAGPLGWLFTQFVPEEALPVRLVGGFLFKLALMTTLVLALSTLPRARYIGTVIAIYLVGWMFTDATYLFILSAIVFAWVLPRPDQTVPRWALPWAIAALAFLAHVKFTYWVLAATGIGCGALSSMWQRRWRQAAMMVGGYTAALMAIWLLTAQNPVRLITFIRMSWEISTGYAAAMALDEPPSVFWLGVGTALTFAAWLWWVTRQHQERFWAWPAGAFAFAAAFVAWKHGFTRADGHVLGFFAYTIVSAVALPGWWQRRRALSGLEPAALLAIAGIWAAAPALFVSAPRAGWDRAVRTVRVVSDFVGWRGSWQAHADRERAQAALPALKQHVGDATIDSINHDQGVLLLNDLRYHPRPVLQSYSAYTPTLMWRNLRFIQSTRAPDYLLVRLRTIDDRYPIADDALLMAALPRWYEPVATERDFSLLRRRNARPEKVDLERQADRHAIVRLGEPVELPIERSHALWLRVLAPPSETGRLRSLLYKPAQLQFVITDFEGRETRRRLLPRVAEEGFLIQPIIETQGDFDAFMRGHGHRWAKSVRVEAAPGEEEFWLQVRIEVYRLPDLPIVPVHRNEAVVETGATNRPPLEYGAELPTELMSIEGRPSLFIHAPGKMIVQPAPEDRRLTGWFGLRSPAYDIGHSDGVEFIIDAVWPDGGRQNLLRRLVEPLARTTDRGSQPFTITLPEKAGFKLELLTHAGPTGDSGWDWSYWSELRFAP